MEFRSGIHPKKRQGVGDKGKNYALSDYMVPQILKMKKIQERPKVQLILVYYKKFKVVCSGISIRLINSFSPTKILLSPSSLMQYIMHT